MRELAELWNVDPMPLPHWSPPTNANEIFRYAEQGSVGFLWIAGTTPAVSMPDLARIRRILSGDQCFVVVSDGHRTETTELADVVLPAALWAEKTGTFTNVDRTVHLQEKAVEPPGQARGDQAVFTDYARRLGLTDKDGNPLPAWDTPEQAFEAWKAASAGRPCDYSGLTYGKLHDVGGFQWPCTHRRPTAPNGSTPTGCSTPTSTCARPTATIWPPAHRSAKPPTARVASTAAPSSRPPPTSTPSRNPTTPTRCA
ncbi:molybdopterin-dependent oxidoreductase [Streptomyces coelicoflavus]|uniref:molybdopterin-dependent oxidoreductase n=1 Tax=Streptomyces coelicoflavus TaxID=285562 RepID=UPI0035AB683E